MMTPSCDNQPVLASCCTAAPPTGAVAPVNPTEPLPAQRGQKRQAEAPAAAGDNTGVPAEAPPAKRVRVARWFAALIEAAAMRLRMRLRPVDTFLTTPCISQVVSVAAPEAPLDECSAKAQVEQNVATMMPEAKDTEPSPQACEVLPAMADVASSWQAHMEHDIVKGTDEVTDSLGTSLQAVDVEMDGGMGVEEKTPWVIADKDVDVFQAADSDEVTGILQEGQKVEVAGTTVFVDGYEMIPIQPKGAVQSDFVHFCSQTDKGDSFLPVEHTHQEEMDVVCGDGTSGESTVEKPSSRPLHMDTAKSAGA